MGCADPTGFMRAAASPPTITRTGRRSHMLSNNAAHCNRRGQVLPPGAPAGSTPSPVFAPSAQVDFELEMVGNRINSICTITGLLLAVCTSSAV